MTMVACPMRVASVGICVGEGVTIAVAVGDDVAVIDGVNVAVIVAVANTTDSVDVGSFVRSLVDTIQNNNPPIPMTASNNMEPIMSNFFTQRSPTRKQLSSSVVTFTTNPVQPSDSGDSFVQLIGQKLPVYVVGKLLD